MTVKKKFDKAEELRSFIEQNRSEFDKIYVKEIYNLGDTQPSESPLFIYSGYSIIMAYLSEGTLFLNIYDKDFFIRNIRGGVFREKPDSERYSYVYFPGSKLINSPVQNIEIQETENGRIKSLDLAFINGQHLSVNHSDSLKGTMNSFFYD